MKPLLVTLFNDRVDSLFVVAAGNRGMDLTGTPSGVEVSQARIYPAALGGRGSYHNVVSVAAHDAEGRLAPFSNFGIGVDIAAPGCRIESWVSDGQGAPDTMSGTSQAAPFVTLTAALLASVSDRVEPFVLKSRIYTSGDLLFVGDQKRVESRSRLNVAKALYVFDDYVRYATGEEWLGRITRVSPIRCDGGADAQTLDQIWSYKRDSEAWLYYGRSNDQLNVCRATATSEGPSEIVFEPSHRIEEGGVLTPNQPGSLRLDLAAVSEFIISNKMHPI